MKPKRKRNSQAGVAVLLAVMLLAILSIGVALTWRGLNQGWDRQTRADRETAAWYLAEAGLEKALAMMQVNPAYAGETDTPLGGGSFSVSVHPGEAGRMELRATGKRAAAEIQLTAELQRDESGRITACAVQPKRALP